MREVIDHTVRRNIWELWQEERITSLVWSKVLRYKKLAWTLAGWRHVSSCQRRRGR